jgi:hypothetical protein
MIKRQLISDHLNKWSDNYEKSICCIAAEKAEGLTSSTAANECYSPGIFDRTLQKMRKTRMSMCSGTWAWSKILSFSKSYQWKTSGRLRSPGLLRTSRKIPGQLSNYQGNPQGNLHYQLRTFAPPGAIIGNRHVFQHYHTHRYRRGSYAGCQYDRRISEDSIRRNLKHGGQL